MSIEIPRPNFRSSELVVISDRRLRAAEEFKFFVRQVISDPQANQLVRSQDEVFVISTVPFWADTTKKLKAKQEIDLQDSIQPQIVFELAVLHQDGDMSFEISEDNLLTIDLEDDGYSQMILDYFRIQYS